jgi:hypothetical protein
MSKYLKFDLVKISTKGATGAKEVLIGSNAAAVVKGAVSPVLIIPEKASYKKFTNFTFVFDLKTINNSRRLDFI